MFSFSNSCLFFRMNRTINQVMVAYVQVKLNKKGGYTGVAGLLY